MFIIIIATIIVIIIIIGIENNIFITIVLLLLSSLHNVQIIPEIISPQCWCIYGLVSWEQTTISPGAMIRLPVSYSRTSIMNI